MRKTNILLIIALTLAMFASVTLTQIPVASAQEVPPVGVVVAYVPGQSITIVDQSGMQHEYLLSPSLKILPPGSAISLAIGSFVTIIAPASLGDGKQTAVGIVVHPHIPIGWNVAILSATPLATGTAIASPTGTLTSETPTPTGTLATDTATETPTASETATETPPGVATFTDTPTPTATPGGGGTTISTNAFIEWLRDLFRQLLSSS